MAVAGENYAWATLVVLIKDCFFRHISEVKEKLSLTVIFEYNGRQNNNKKNIGFFAIPCGLLLKVRWVGGRFGSRRLLDITLEKLRCSFSG